MIKILDKKFILKNDKNTKETTWDKVMSLKKKDDMKVGLANTLKDHDIETIIATADFFGAEERDLHQIYLDLKVARFRVFEWLAMAINGRLENQSAIKVFAHSFIKSNGVTSKFIQDLRETDYDIDNSWQDIELDF